MGFLALALRLALATIFAVAGVAKLSDRRGTERALLSFRVPKTMVPAMVIALPLLELSAAVALVPGPTARWGATLAALLLIGFIVGIAAAMLRGEEPDCHCFGQVQSAPAGGATLIRNLLLLGVALVIAIAGPGQRIDRGTSTGATSAIAVAAAIAAVLLVAIALALWAKNRT